MDASATASAKAALRKRMRALRAGLSRAERDRARSAIGESLGALLTAWPPEARTWVALFAPASTEASAAGAANVLRAAGWKTAYPAVDGEGLTFAGVDDERALTPGHRGILEPTPAMPRVAVPELAVLLVPGLAFDRAGGRLGQGGGHYDRTLAVLPATSLTVGVCFAVQLVAAVPREPWDLTVDAVLTEEGLLATANKPLPEVRVR